MKKKDVLSIIDSLEKINNSVARNLAANIPVAAEVLVDCQDSAIMVGNEIEKCGQEGEEIVHLLEAYCENIYQMSCQATDFNGCRKLTKKIQKQLIQVRNMIKYDIPEDRKQVVFLPYKASMWDSLESIWKAADADSDCDAYVIPIPYYDKNPDGSFKQMHYEGGEYPDYVPITDYNAYNFEEQHPDMIFIHNPYDEFNHVTSVHPFFYSKNLKQYTDMLVYIPYFVLGDIDPADQTAVKNIEHFCTVPAVVHADLTIVQSENMRKIYINAMTEAVGKETKAIWVSKILGLGSPKYDKVINAVATDIEIPEEWRRIIEKPDGSRKRVVFYNTSVATLLKYEEKLLCKMWSVFDSFRANREDIALLWRPHPLIKATIESMRPALWAEYEKLLREYCEGGWGIYDDSADLNRAVALSDVYYGDPSSVVQLFHEVGKQTIIQDIYSKDYEYSIAGARAITHIAGEYWYVERADNVLYSMNDISYESRRMAQFDEESGRDLFTGVVVYNEKLFFIPNLARTICVYDRKKCEPYQIEFLKDDGFSCPELRCKFASGIVIGHHLYLIPCIYNSMVIIDMQNDTIEYQQIHSGQEIKRISSGEAVTIDDEIFFGFINEKCILKYNCRRKTLEKIFPGNEKRAYLHLFYDNDRFWLIPYDIHDGIRVWDMRTDRFEDVILLPEEIIAKPEASEIEKYLPDIAELIQDDKISYFGHGALMGQDIYLFSSWWGQNVVIHTKQREYEFWDIELHCSPGDMYLWARNDKFISFVQRNDEFYLTSGLTKEWFLRKNNTWERVERHVSAIKDGEKIFMLDSHEVTWEGAIEMQRESNVGSMIWGELHGK